MIHSPTVRDGCVATTIVFACDVIGGELKPQDDETLRLEYFEPAEMPQMKTPFPKHFFTDAALAFFFEWEESWLDLDK